MLRVIISVGLSLAWIVALIALYWFVALVAIYLGIATALFPSLIWFDYALLVLGVVALIKIWRL